MIDSGILSGAALDADAANLVYRAIAHQLGLPLALVTNEYLSFAEHVATEMDLVLPTAANFERFCAAASDDITRLTEFSRRLQATNAAPVFEYPHPLYRHLKDHMAVQLFELSAFLELRSVPVGETRNVDSVLVGCGFSSLVERRRDGLLLVGPVFMEDGSGQGSTHAYFDQFATSIAGFSSAIDIFFRQRPINTAGTPSNLYTQEYLSRIAFSRQKTPEAIVRRKLEFARRCLDTFATMDRSPDGQKVTPTFYSKIVAALAATETHGHGSIRFKVFSGPEAPSVRAIEINSERASWVNAGVEPAPDDVAFAERYAMMAEASFQNWNVYVAESLTQLRNWLTTRRLPISGETDLTIAGHFGRRLTRFLASAFGAYECTLYRIVHTETGLRLLSVGAHTADRHTEERLSIAQSDMDALLPGYGQDRSISYRCAKQRKAQYCQYFDHLTGRAWPPRQSLSVPEKPQFLRWSVSACAIPIQVNGRAWGVLQLISRSPHAFPEVMRAKAAEACGIIGSHLFRQELLNSIYRINAVISDPQVPVAQKRSSIERSLAQMFGAKTFAILRLEPESLHGSANVFLEAGRSDLNEFAKRPEDERDYFAPFHRFAAGPQDSWGAVIGSDEFRQYFSPSHRRKFYVQAREDFIFMVKMKWELSNAASINGVVALTYDHAMIEQENWRETIEFICQYISTITGSLYSSELWERRLREKIGHELTKISLSLDSSISRLGTRDRQVSSTGTSNVIPAVIGDLKKHSKALDRYVKILTTHRDVSDFDNEPQLYLIHSSRQKYLSERNRRGARFREEFLTAFQGQSKRFAQAGIDIPRAGRFMDFVVDMDDLSLREVLSTLVDNLVKYTKPGTEILAQPAQLDKMSGISISNVGLRLDEDEKATIFEDSIRGRRAQVLTSDGLGFGLWFARKAMNVWGCGLLHNQRLLDTEDMEYARHDFRLMFRNRMISNRKGGFDA